MKPKIWLSSPHMSGREMKYINEAFTTNWIAPLGPNVDKFEKDLSNYLSVKSAAALSSGTAAIHLALIVLGVKQGDEVMCSTFTFAASANPVVYQGAVPVFVDSEPDTWNMDAALLDKAIGDRLAKGKKPKAIIVVHLYGMPANLNEILAVAAKYNIPVIEDAAEAIGSEYENKKCGSFGNI
nr:aminotransferase class I/II-fold pyridoxal phosphate-dependent enzyme [Bacteroidales bacterium]